MALLRLWIVLRCWGRLVPGLEQTAADKNNLKAPRARVKSDLTKIHVPASGAAPSTTAPARRPGPQRRATVALARYRADLAHRSSPSPAADVCHAHPLTRPIFQGG